MRSRAGLCVLALLCLHSSVLGQVLEVQQGVLIFCDDPSVEKAVSSAVHKFNEKLSTGHKLALFQILSASKSENGADSVYSLQFTTRRSDCPVGSSKPWTDCDYLHPSHRAPISCNATVFMTETDADTKQVDCFMEQHIPSEKAPCLGCPEDINESSDDIKGPLSVSISKYNSISDSAHLFTLHNVGPATRQVVAGLRYKLMFDMRKTTCAKAEHKDLDELCALDEQNVEFANCNSTVDVAPWRLEPPEAHLQCEAGPLPMKLVSRRRPPGFSPLRNLLFEVPSTAASPPPPSVATDKEESSEEDTTTSKPTSATETADAVNNNPFHCPSKPWKPFNPPKASLETAPTQPSVDGALSDTDLLA